MRLEVVRQKDAQQRGGARTLLAPGAVRGDARGDEGRDRDGRRDADPSWKKKWRVPTMSSAIPAETPNSLRLWTFRKVSDTHPMNAPFRAWSTKTTRVL